MNRVVLVDDEKFVRKGIRSLIDWNALGFDICNEADNGEDALEIIINTKPDLVITDIRMPILNGLQLIKTIVDSKAIQTKFVVISGYNEFSYAQQAVRYGVHDFLLKPIDKEELISTIARLSKSLNVDKQMQIEQTQERLDALFSLIVTGRGERVQRAEFEEMVKYKDMEEFYYVIIEINEVFPIHNEIGKTSDSIKKIIRESVFSESMGNMTVAIHEIERGGIYGILIPQHFWKRCHYDVENYIKELQRKLNIRLQKKLTVYIGRKIKQLQSLNDAYQTARKAMQFKYLYRKQDMIFYQDIIHKPIYYTDIDNKLFYTLLEKIEENDEQAIIRLVHSIFENFVAKNFARDAVKTSINRCIHAVLRTMKTMEGDVDQMRSLENMLSWYNYNLTLSELERLFREFMLDASRIMVSLRKEIKKSEIHRIKQYIEMHYMEDIHLKSIAQQFYMNPVYMGQLFKKTYGVYFKEYLLQVRIHEAKKLLRQTDKRIYEISELVGFCNTDYFVTQFGKIVGMTPTEYRSQL